MDTISSYSICKHLIYRCVHFVTIAMFLFYFFLQIAFFFSVKVCAVLMAVVGTVCFIFAPQIVPLFRIDDPIVAEVGAFALRAQCLTYVFGVWIILTNMLLQASGRAFGATVISSCRSGLCFIPVILILPHFMGLTGVQISQAVADMIAFVISFGGCLYFLSKLERMSREQEKSETTS